MVWWHLREGKGHLLGIVEGEIVRCYRELLANVRATSLRDRANSMCDLCVLLVLHRVVTHLLPSPIGNS